MNSHSVSLRDTECFIPVEDGLRVWTRCLGGGSPDERAPIIVLHGGPGIPHDYLENLAALASPIQRLVFYDQLGCGHSDCPDEPQRWRLPRFVTEIDQVRQALGLERVVLLGQSWGGMLAIEYALMQPQGLIGLILANSTASAPLFAAETQRLRAMLPPEIQTILTYHENAGTTDHAAYQTAMGAFYARHVIRLHPMPECVQRAFNQAGQPYGVMWGASEFNLTGNLKEWDRTDRLGEIRVPTLLISGEYDESTPAINRALQRGLPDARWVMLDNCSHLAHVEAPDQYQQAVRDFLDSLPR